MASDSGGRNLHQGMLRTAFVLNVLIASPSDVSEERDVVTNAVLAWNAANYASTGIMLNPVRWETHSYPASGERPQAILNKQIVEQGDFLIGIFGNRLGTPTGDSQSGTIEEIEIFRRSGNHVALYFSTADVPRNADRDQLEALEGYQRERQRDTLYATFGTPDELRQKVTQHLPGSQCNNGTSKHDRSSDSIPCSSTSTRRIARPPTARGWKSFATKLQDVVDTDLLAPLHLSSCQRDSLPKVH